MNTRRDVAIDSFDSFRQFVRLKHDTPVLSVTMFAFGLSFQAIGRYIPEYLQVFEAGAIAVGLYGSVGNPIGALYPYPGGTLFDRPGFRLSLTLFGTLSSASFLFWLVVPQVPEVTLAGVLFKPWFWTFIGLLLTQAWGSFGLGVTFVIVRRSIPSKRLAMEFASTRTFRRVGFLLGPLITAALSTVTATLVEGFQYVLTAAATFGIAVAAAQYLFRGAGEDSLGKLFGGLAQLRDDPRSFLETLRPFLVTDTLIRPINGMMYTFFVIVITELLEVGFTGLGVSLHPDAFFSVLLDMEMVVTLLTKLPVPKLAERTGLKPVVVLGLSVYAVFPVLLILAPADQWVVVALFAFSKFRFAGLFTHKMLIVGPAERNAGGRVMGIHHLPRNTIAIPSAAFGGWLYARDPTLTFSVAPFVGAVGVVYFVLRDRGFAAYAGGA